MGSPRITLAGWLVRMGFADAARAERMLRDDLALDFGEPPGEAGAAEGVPAQGVAPDDALVVALASAADPDLAVASLVRIFGQLGRDAGSLREALRGDEGLRTRLAAVLGASAALGDHVVRHPADLELLRGPDAAQPPGQDALREELLAAVGLAAGTDSSAAAADPAAALAAAYHRRLLHLAARDLTGASTLEEVAAELADLAAAVLGAALRLAGGEVAGGEVAGNDQDGRRFAIIAMGKCGGRELNYASDVDVIFVADQADEGATGLAAGVIGICARSSPEGAIFPVDPNLRPEGRNGPLVRTLAGHLAYYQRWAKTWEFQALLKARAVAGDQALGGQYEQAVTPLVWEAAQRENFVEDVQAMRRRVERSLPAQQAGRELKLGPGGLRDIEFAVQLLQLVHGRTDETLHGKATLEALRALAAGGYVGRKDADELAQAYRFLRRTEHLLQLRQLRRTHVLPADPATLRRLGRAMKLGAAGDPADAFTEQWRLHSRQVRRLHEKLFYRPLLDAVARLPSDAARLTPQAAQARLEALGYVDPAGALRHIEALTTGVSRRAAIQRTLLPVLLGWFADAAEPDAGLLAFRQVSEALGETPWYLRLLRDETKAAMRIARVLASSRYATGLLLRAPEAVAMFAEDNELLPRGIGTLRSEMKGAAGRHADEPQAAVAAIRSLRRRELLRIAAADALAMTGLAATEEALTSVARAAIEAALAVAINKVETDRGEPLKTRFAVIAMGRFGGHETGFGSDADVVFVHEGAGAEQAAHAVAEELRRLLALPSPDPPLIVDADLRPEGRQGPLVRTLAAYRAYYQRWSAPWEAQALLRAEFVAGDEALGAEFAAMADEFRYPADGIEDQAVREIRRVKARVEAERIPRGAEPALHVKLGPGGLSDVEWTVQLLQLRHGARVPGLRTTRTRDALAAAVAAGLVSAADASALSAAWELASRIRNAITLVRGRPGDTLPSRQVELTAVARLLGYQPGGAALGAAVPVSPGQALAEDYRRTARRARGVMEALFYGEAITP